MRLAQLASLSLLSLRFVLQNVSANPLPIALPAAMALPEPQSSCNNNIPCSDDGSLCCASNQHCASWGKACGEGSLNTANGNPGPGFRIWTTTILSTGTSVQTIISVFSSQTEIWQPPLVTNDPNPSGSNPSGSGGVVYPTLVPSVSGGNTFLVPMPTASNTAGFGYGGIIGTNSPPQGLSSAQIGGIVGGILGAFFLIALILICCCMNRGFNGFFGWMNSWGHEGTVVTHGSSHSSHGGGYGGLSAAAAGGLGYLFGRKGAHGSSSSHHVVHGSGHHSSIAKKTGMAALLGGAAAGLTGLFASRRKPRMSEKYSTTDISSGYYTSDITSSTSYTSSNTSSSSSSSSSS